MPDNISSQLQATFGDVINQIIAQLPGILGALLLLLAGWLLARVVRSVTIKLLNLLNRFLERVLSGRTRAVVRFSTGVTRLVAGVLFWVTLFIFTTAALRTAGLLGIAAWLERIVDYLPSILTGGLIILVGYVLSTLVRDVTHATAHSAELVEAELISRLAQAITFITALIIGMEQVGVNTSFITIMLGVFTATLLAGFALAFGFGARTLVSNLLAAHYAKDLLEPGQNVRIGDCEGKVLDLSATNIIIDTPQGRTSIPAKIYQEQAVSVLLEDE